MNFRMKPPIAVRGWQQSAAVSRMHEPYTQDTQDTQEAINKSEGKSKRERDRERESSPG